MGQKSDTVRGKQAGLRGIARAAQIEASEREYQTKLLAPLRLTASNRARSLLKVMKALVAAESERPAIAASPKGLPKGLFAKSQVRKLVRENPGMKADAIEAFSTPELFAGYLDLLLLRLAYDRSGPKRGRGRPRKKACRYSVKVFFNSSHVMRTKGVS